MKRILVPCDFSELSWQALRVSAELGARMPVEVVILTVSNPMQPDISAQIGGRRLEEQLRRFPASIKTRLLRREGRFVKAVLDVVESQEIDLVVVGTRGSRGWEGQFVGSHAEKIVRTSPVPVFAVRELSHIPQIRTIVLPLNPGAGLPEAPPCLQQLLELFPVHYHLLYVDTNGRRDENAMKDTLRVYGDAFRIGRFTVAVVRADSEADGILRYANETSADMIAMGTMGDPDPEHMFRPSVAADIVNHAKVPVWTCLIGKPKVYSAESLG